MVKDVSCRALLAALSCCALCAGQDGPLDRYVAAPDSAYHYQLSRTTLTPGGFLYELDLTSQTWLSTAEVDRPEFRHVLTILKPFRVTSETALLYIDGGWNGLPVVRLPLYLLAGVQAGTVVVQLSQVPNQPLAFADESRTRSEDAITAYTWDKYLKTGDERWPARLPMTKAAVRAMDAATDFLAKAPGGGAAVRNFIMTGASKRGLTTWTAAAVDPRVIAIAPLVCDVLNTEQSLLHHFRAYGFWAPALQDYVEAGIMGWLGTPQLESLMEIEDPFAYRERLQVPKYLLQATGDQFFLPDSSQFYFDALPGEKYLRYVPNTDHFLLSAETPRNLMAWMRAILAGHPRPRFSWSADRPGGTITLRTEDQPMRVLLWRADNPAARDFRLQTIGPAWRSEEVRSGDGVYTAHVPAPEAGYAAFFLELTYRGSSDLPLVFTTEVVVTPDAYPFEMPASGGAAGIGSAGRRGGR